MRNPLRSRRRSQLKLRLNSLEFGAFSLSLSCCTNHIFRLCRDTVNSVGIFPNRLPFTTSNKLIKTFRHAVSLDERRAKFKVVLSILH